MSLRSAETDGLAGFYVQDLRLDEDTTHEDAPRKAFFLGEKETTEKRANQTTFFRSALVAA